jgi:hypothetical protein
LSQGENTEAEETLRRLIVKHREFADKLADRQSMTVPAIDPDFDSMEQAFPAWTGPGKAAILEPPKPHFPPSEQILERAAACDRDLEATD